MQMPTACQGFNFLMKLGIIVMCIYLLVEYKVANLKFILIVEYKFNFLYQIVELCEIQSHIFVKIYSKSNQ